MAILNKMTGFKVYKGTKADFISSGKAAANVDAIVFITGGSDASKSCIYAQGTYFANFAELIAAINYVKGITVGETSYNAAVGGGYIGFGANDPSTVSVDVQNGKITVGLTDTFVNKVNNTATALGTAGDAAKSDGSAFARIAALAADLASLTGSSSGSIAEQIAAVKSAIEGTLGNDDAKTLAAINDELDAIDAKWASYVSKAELEAIEDTKANGTSVNVSVTTKGGKVTAVAVDETGLNTALGLKANAADVYTKNDVYTKTEADTMAQGKVDALANNAVKANTDAIATLNGNNTVEGSVDKKIYDAINAFAGTADADNVIENVTELLNYVAGVDGSTTLATAIAQIAENKGKIETLNGTATTAGSVAKAVADEASLRESADGALNGRIDALAAVVGAPESDVEATGIFKVIEENEKVAAETYTNLNTRLAEVEATKDIVASALQSTDITTGSANGTIAVKGSNIAVNGLGSAAFTASTDYATAAQGAKADTAYQKPTAGIPASDLAFAVYTQAEVNAMWAWEEL